MSSCLLCGKKAQVVARHYGRKMPFCTQYCSDALCDLVEKGPHATLIGPKYKEDQSGDPVVQALVAQLESLAISDEAGSNLPAAALASWATVPLDVKILILSQVSIFDFLRTARVSKAWRADLNSPGIWKHFYTTRILPVTRGSAELIAPSWREQAFMYMSVFDFLVRDTTTDHIVKALPFARGFTGAVACVNRNAADNTIVIYNTAVLNKALKRYAGDLEGFPDILSHFDGNSSGDGTGIGRVGDTYAFEMTPTGFKEPVSIGRRVADSWNPRSGSGWGSAANEFTQEGIKIRKTYGRWQEYAPPKIVPVPMVIMSGAFYRPTWSAVPVAYQYYRDDITLFVTDESGYTTADLRRTLNDRPVASNHHCTIKSRFVMKIKDEAGNTVLNEAGYGQESVRSDRTARGTPSDVDVTLTYELFDPPRFEISTLPTGVKSVSVTFMAEPHGTPVIVHHARRALDYNARIWVNLTTGNSSSPARYAVPIPPGGAERILAMARNEPGGEDLGPNTQTSITAVVRLANIGGRLGVVLQDNTVVPFQWNHAPHRDTLVVPSGLIAKKAHC